MKITIINTSDRTGGAAIAANRLFEALLDRGYDVSMLVNHKTLDHQRIVTVNKSNLARRIAFLRFAMERLWFFFFKKDRSVLFAFSPGLFGRDISRHALVRDADIIHLHWINGGFLSNRTLKKLMSLNKPIVWTFHDMWAFTGGCHYSLDCTYFQTGCHDCHYLKNPGNPDLSTRYFRVKERLYEHASFSIITCSAWLKSQVLASRLLKHMPVQHIRNLVDLGQFHQLDKREVREELGLPADSRLVLFGAMNIADTRKGFNYFREALEILHKEEADIEILLFGKSSPAIMEGIPFRIHDMGVIRSEEEMVKIYNAADMFVIPSVQDNLPNTIVEAHACGTPVVGFDMAGIPEMIDHRKNGYLAKAASAEDLASGIRWLSNEADLPLMRKNARTRAEQQYDPGIIVDEHLALYKKNIDEYQS